MALSKQQKATANLVYNQAVKAGLKPKRAKEFVAAAYAESGLNPRATNKSSGAAGLFQLLSSGYVNRAKAAGGVYNPVANIKSILPAYKQYWATHPNAAPGQGGATVEASGMGASFYSRPLGLLGALSGSPVAGVPGSGRPGFPSVGNPQRTVIGPPVTLPALSFDPGLAKSYNQSMKALGLSGLNFNSLSLPAMTYRPSTTVPGTPGRKTAKKTANGKTAPLVNDHMGDYPLAKKGKVIGTPYAGTHTLGNWESDRAVDISVPKGTPVRATENGVIGSQIGALNSSDPHMLGLRVHLDSATDSFYYAHLSRLTVKAGQHVKKGQIIGYSGVANGVAHLHFASQKRDPRQYL